MPPALFFILRIALAFWVWHIWFHIDFMILCSVCMLSCFRHVWLFAALWTVALQAPGKARWLCSGCVKNVTGDKMGIASAVLLLWGGRWAVVPFLSCYWECFSHDVISPWPPDKQGSHDDRSQASCEDGKEDENLAWGLPVSCDGAHETAEWLMGPDWAGLLGVTHFWRTQETWRFCYSPEARGAIIALQSCLERELWRIVSVSLFSLLCTLLFAFDIVWLFFNESLKFLTFLSRMACV